MSSKDLEKPKLLTLHEKVCKACEELGTIVENVRPGLEAEAEGKSEIEQQGTKESLFRLSVLVESIKEVRDLKYE